MGIGASLQRPRPPSERCICIQNKFGKSEKVFFTDQTSLHTLDSLIRTTAGCDQLPGCPMLLQAQDGHLMTLDYVARHVNNDNGKPFRVQVVCDSIEQTRLMDGIASIKKDITDIKSVLSMYRSHSDSVMRKRDVNQFKEMVIDAKIKEELRTPAFNMWSYGGDELLCLLEFMYFDMEVVDEFRIAPMVLRRWLLCVQDNYQDVPFHNFRHGFAVAQMLYGLKRMCRLDQLLSRRELCTMLIACTCHDLDHPGLSNGYHIKSSSELAIRYNDFSPLENHHSTLTFRMLAVPELNILSNLQNSEYRIIRKLIINLILATDMAKHQDYVTAFKARLPEFNWESDDHRLHLMQMIMKVCDVSNEIRPPHVSETWLDVLLEEYFIQGDREKREGYVCDAFMDRTVMTKSKAQIGFIRYVLIPLYELVGTMLPQITERLVPKLRLALAHYEQLEVTELASEVVSDISQGLQLSAASSNASQILLEHEEFVRRMSITLSASVMKDNLSTDSQSVHELPPAAQK